MTDSIIVLILVVLIAIGVRATSKHFKGEGSCCGGGTYKLRKKEDEQCGEPLWRV